MSGEYAKIFKRIWGDPDFKTLNIEEQALYIKLFSQTDISMAGVLTLATTRWATQTDGLTVPKVEKTLRTLEQRGYIVTDPDTQEVLLRSYIRNDGGWVSNKTLIGVTNAVRRVLSPRLRMRSAGTPALTLRRASGCGAPFCRSAISAEAGRPSSVGVWWADWRKLVSRPGRSAAR